MANVLITPNMNLPNPVPGTDPGPDYANNLQSSLVIIDQHNHSNGSGVPINPNGILINADLPYNSNNATTLRSVRFLQQLTPLSMSTDVACLYSSVVSSNAELFYNDSSGNRIQVTSGGTVNATSSGISSGSASASFSSGVLVVNQATNTPGNIQLGSLLLGNNTAGSNFLTLKPPSAMGSSYSLTLPSIPASTQFVTIDTSGNLSTTTSVAATQIQNQGIQQAQLQARSTGVSVGAGGIAVSVGSGSYSNSTTSFVQVTPTITIVTTGRPVFINTQWDRTASPVPGIFSASVVSTVEITDGTGSTLYDSVEIGGSVGTNVISQLLFLSAGTYTFNMYAKINTGGGGSIVIDNVVLTAWEI